MKLGLSPVKLTGAKPSPVAGLKLGLAPVRLLVVCGTTWLVGAKPSPTAGLKLGLAPVRILAVFGATRLTREMHLLDDRAVEHKNGLIACRMWGAHVECQTQN